MKNLGTLLEASRGRSKKGIFFFLFFSFERRFRD